MTNLAKAALISGGVLGIMHGLAVLAPRRAGEWLARFPRNRVAGPILASVALIWSAWLLYAMPMESLARFKPSLWALTPAAIFLVARYMDELLAPRALGALMALLAAPLLDAARFHPSLWRLAMVFLAYALAVKGMALMLSPYLFRKGAAFVTRTPGRTRGFAFVGVCVAVFLLVLGWRVY